MLHDVLTVEGWMLSAVKGKVNNCRKRLLEANRATYFAGPNVNTDDEVIAAVFAADGYKTRAVRDAEESA